MICERCKKADAIYHVEAYLPRKQDDRTVRIRLFDLCSGCAWACAAKTIGRDAMFGKVIVMERNSPHALA